MPQAIQRTVELFAGIGGFRIAAERHGIQTLWANDICPRACQVYRSQFGDAEIRQGDIQALAHEIPSHDLLTAGFPCQPFSSAGKKKGLRDPRGHLFAVIMLTDYQTRKTNPPLKLQVIRWQYLFNTQLADFALTAIARKHRDWLLKQSEPWTQKIFRFLAYVNQSHWQAGHLLRIIDVMQSRDATQRLVIAAENDFREKNIQRLHADKEAIPDHQLESLLSIAETQPLILGIVDAADNWVVENYRDVARLPNENEWTRLLASSLDGQIGMSFALQ